MFVSAIDGTHKLYLVIDTGFKNTCRY